MNFRTILLMTFLFSSLFAAEAQTSVTSHVARQPVIIDTDIGDDIDDAFAIGLALCSPEFHIVGITTTYGDTALRAHLAARLLSDAGRGDIPIAVGTATDSHTSFTQMDYARGDHRPVPSVSAVDFMLEQARKHPGEITLIALGPLVNVGEAIDRDPEGFRKFKRVVVMGGSINRGYDHGNKAKHVPPSPEWNIRNDIKSARKLFKSGVPIFMMPLDSTQVKLPAAMQAQIFAKKTGLANALNELCREYMQVKKKNPILYDAVTVAAADNISEFPMIEMHIDVNDKGMTLKAQGPPNAHVCLNTDEKAFLDHLVQALNSRVSAF